MYWLEKMHKWLIDGELISQKVSNFLIKFELISQKIP